METVELKFLNVLIEKLHLTDEEKIDFIEDFEKVRENRLDSSMKEIKSLFKENFYKLELKLEQQNTKLEQFKAELYFKLEQHKLEIDSKFKEQDAKLEQFKAELYFKLEQHKSDNDLKLEQFKTEINTKLGDTKDKLTNLFITGFITVTVMILGLFATIVFKFFM